MGVPFAKILLLCVFYAKLVSVFLLLFLFFRLFFGFGGFLGWHLFLIGGSGGLFKSAKINNLCLMVGQINYLLNRFSLDCSRVVILHGMETNIFEIV